MAKAPSRSSLFDAVERVLGTIRPSGSNLGTANAKGNYAGEDDVYEAFLMMEVVGALERRGITPKVEGPPGAFILRRGPGSLKTSGSEYSYFEFQTNKRDYELHTGIELLSRSAPATVEADVLIISKTHGEEVRDPRKRKPASYRSAYLIIEAKLFSTSLSTVVARSYVGLGVRGVRQSCEEILASYREVDANAKHIVQKGSPKFRCLDCVQESGKSLTALRSRLDVIVAHL